MGKLSKLYLAPDNTINEIHFRPRNPLQHWKQHLPLDNRINTTGKGTDWQGKVYLNLDNTMNTTQKAVSVVLH